ncbi:MAG: penicillin acylase family protein [Planctomycetota bacterium]|nr:penicillin acylase family protein [Planctomycetota bacterium]
MTRAAHPHPYSCLLRSPAIVPVMIAICFTSSSLVNAADSNVVDPTVRSSGSVSSTSVSAEITITYDEFGVPTVNAATRLDAYFAEGYLHAQNRFTQMDLSRRFSSGELSELVGADTLDRDRSARKYRMRETARAVVGMMNPSERAALASYTNGVNAGLDDLPGAPPEYAILGSTPADWSEEDSVLVMLAFMRMLDWTAESEAGYAGFYTSIPAAVREFIATPLSRFDSPVPTLERRPPSIMPVPPREVIMLRELEPVPETITLPPGGGGPPRKGMDLHPFPGTGGDDGEDDSERPTSDEEATPGSNNWAIAGQRTRDGRAILASDPHLGLTLPGAWYRIRMLWPDHDLVGLSIPGIPGIVIGSNGHVAWGFTNLTGDLQDLIMLEINPDNPDEYRTPDGWEPFGEVVEVIGVRGGEPVELPLRTTRWGVVNGRYQDAFGVDREAVIEWAGLHPELCNFKLFELEQARTLEEALGVLGSWYGPPQNAVVASSDGRIGYTITGFLPDRQGVDGRRPYGLWDGTESWSTRPSAPRPIVIDPPQGYVHTANNRTTDLATAQRLGYDWANPSRARRIEDVLALTVDADESDMLALQLDPTVVSYGPWKNLIIGVIAEDDEDESLRAVREALLSWNGRAEPQEVGVTLINDARSRMIGDLRQAIRQWAADSGHGTAIRVPVTSEEPYLRVIEDQKINWLPEGPESDWNEWVRAHVRDSVEAGSLSPWGERNRIVLESPLASMAPPPMNRMLQMELGPQSGHWNAPKVLAPGIGASARLVVSPGREEAGILQTPGGQSGNPLSPHYRDLTASWTAGSPQKLLPGAPAASFTITPAN